MDDSVCIVSEMMATFSCRIICIAAAVLLSYCCASSQSQLAVVCFRFISLRNMTELAMFAGNCACCFAWLNVLTD